MLVLFYRMHIEHPGRKPKPNDSDNLKNVLYQIRKAHKVNVDTYFKLYFFVESRSILRSN